MAGLLETLRGIQFQPSAGSMGLLQMGANLLANSGPSTTPQNFGTALGQGLNGFSHGYMGFNQAQQEQEFQKARMQMLQDQLSMQEAQRSALKGVSLKDQGAVDKLLQAGDVDNAIKLQKLIDPSKGLDPYFQAIPTSDGYVSFNARNGQFSQLMNNGQPLRQPAADPVLQGQLSYQKSANDIAKFTSGDGRDLYAKKGTLSNLSGIDNATGTAVQSSGNSVGVFENPAGELIKLGIKPSGDKLLDSKTLIDFYNSNPGAATPVNNAGTPISIGQSTADKEYAQTSAQESAKQQAGINQKLNDARDVLSYINEIEPTVATATGSGLGKMRDDVMGFFGQTTPEANAAAQLKVIEGNLIAKMPKMSGPQSDRDAMIYKQMAAEVGNDAIPSERRLAALNELKRLNQKYIGTYGSGDSATTQQGNNGGWSIRRAD